MPLINFLVVCMCCMALKVCTSYNVDPYNEFLSCKPEQIDIGSFQKRSILPPRRKFLPSGGGGGKIVSDNSKRISTSKGGRGVNFLFPLWGWYGSFLE